MKRVGNLMGQIAGYENLLLAFYKAGKGKRHQRMILAYEANLEDNLVKLRCDLLHGTVDIGKYHFFRIYDPKERMICASPFSERVLQHAIMNVCHDSFEKYQVDHSYASRKDKGTWAAIAQAFKNQKRFDWFMKIDCRKYFDSINHAVLKKLLIRRFKDPELLSLFFSIIDSYETVAGKGVPIGNLSSQYFANHYLAVADHYLCEQLKAPAMVRYMDDVLIWHHDKNELSRVGILFKRFCKEKLDIEFKHQYMNRTTSGVSFLGVFVDNKIVRLNKASKIRLEKNYTQTQRQFDKKLINEKEYQQQLAGLLNRPLKVNSYHFRKNLFWNTGNKKSPSGRQLLEQCAELPCSQSQRQPTRQPEQQYRLSVRPFSSSNNQDIHGTAGVSCPELSDEHTNRKNCVSSMDRKGSSYFSKS